ncbi:MAG: LysM peptidoglycan-binding domain-containing protein [Anaerolineae bacterium]|jgi:LysM repeat protein|nr:LysM peptidoglycan-binding domain-containing protein [Anaerolineae bacterium]MBT7070159.1 LysM peptidoglycan-binding domain-containing protein [Anaerolineae bacterium]MBT7324029.1 LysM peptidoglycan-binding domain-containing protein [Anaerolineae bacterium]
MARKKSVIVFITALILMAFISVGCERSYAPIDESQATPSVDGGDFPEALPSDMEGVFASGAQTATALAIEGGAAAATEVPTEAGNGTEPDGETPTETPMPAENAGDPTATPSPTSTLPVIEATTAVPSSTPSVGGGVPATYTLEKGEFPYCITRRFNVDPGELLSLNSISNASAGALQPGLNLKIPQSGASFPGNRAWHTHPTTYVLSEASTVYAVACYFGDVEPSAILSANPAITNPDLISAGTSLQIP